VAVFVSWRFIDRRNNVRKTIKEDLESKLGDKIFLSGTNKRRAQKPATQTKKMQKIENAG
jgi:hypothetical protein